mgnify:CR=1 FL=1
MKITINEKIVTEIDLDFDKLTGNDLIAAEKETRHLGDHTPSVLLSMTYQASIVAKVVGVPVDDILALSATDFKKLIAPTASFLLG